jgi:hypothetical protein
MMDVAKHRQFFDIVELLLAKKKNTTQSLNSESRLSNQGRHTYTRSDSGIIRDGVRRGVMIGVHSQHCGDFLGRYRFLDPPADMAVLQIQAFRQSLQANDVSFHVLDEVQPQQLDTAITMTLSHTVLLKNQDKNNSTTTTTKVLRRSSIGTHEHMIIVSSSSPSPPVYFEEFLLEESIVTLS